jgi:hypothetical protein
MNRGRTDRGRMFLAKPAFSILLKANRYAKCMRVPVVFG